MHPDASALLRGGFIALPLVMLFLGVRAAHRQVAAGTVERADVIRLAILGLAGLYASAQLALSGITADFSAVPPPALPVFGVLFLGTLAFGLSPVGRRLSTLPLRLLVGLHAFRTVVEVLIHQAAVEGIAPPQLTWSGRNLDIITGVLAVPLGVWADRLPKGALWAFNLVGLGLLINVVTVAILSMPTPFQQFTPDNTWVGSFPFIWLPAGLVTAALLGHVLLTRRLLRGDAPR